MSTETRGLSKLNPNGNTRIRVNPDPKEGTVFIVTENGSHALLTPEEARFIAALLTEAADKVEQEKPKKLFWTWPVT